MYQVCKCTGIQVVVQKLTERNRHNTTNTGETRLSPGETGTFLAHMLDLYVIDHVSTSAPAHNTENARLRLYILAHGKLLM
jgi:hypothetical protein